MAGLAGTDHCSSHHNTSRDYFEIEIKVALFRDLVTAAVIAWWNLLTYFK